MAERPASRLSARHAPSGRKSAIYFERTLEADRFDGDTRDGSIFYEIKPRGRGCADACWVGPLAALAADQKAAVLLLTTSLAAPIAGYVFARAAGTWQPIENGQATIQRELPHLPRHLTALPTPVDPLLQQQEVRQMLEGLRVIPDVDFPKVELSGKAAAKVDRVDVG